MWDRPALLNAIADALFIVALVAGLGAAASWTMRLPQFALREVRIEGALRHVTRDEVEAAVRRGVRGGFFTISLPEARAEFERLAWVRGASVRRQWPARLEVTLEEHVPFARWGADALVNTHGEVFKAAYEGDLPAFIGPEGFAREMAIQYRYFRRGLREIGESPVEIQVSARRAWQVKLASGTMLVLGREQIEARLARFLAAHARTLGPLGRRVDYVDLRYPNGFAVRVPELVREKPAARGRRGSGETGKRA